MSHNKELLEAIAMADTNDPLVRKLALGVVLALLTVDSARVEVAKAEAAKAPESPRLRIVREP